MKPLDVIVHVFSRGVEKRTIFLSDNDRERFLYAVRLSRLKNSPAPSVLERQIKAKEVEPETMQTPEKIYGPAIVSVLGFCLMSNHYHLTLLITDKDNRALTNFMRRLNTGYTKYFNTKYKRKGHLFESRFRSVEITHEEQLMRVLRYIHLNPAKHLSLSHPEEYRWSSLADYLGTKAYPWINTEYALSILPHREDFKIFTLSGFDISASELLYGLDDLAKL